MRLHLLSCRDPGLQALAHICYNFPQMIEFHDDFTSETIYDTITKLAPQINETLLFGYWRKDSFGCCDNFAPVFTGQGLCFAFNSLNSNEVYTEE